MNIWKVPNTPTHVDDVIFKHRQCEWVLPLAVAEHLRYNPRHVPTIKTEVWTWHDDRGTYVHIMEHTRSDFDYWLKRVFSSYSGSKERICPPQPSSSLLPSVQFS